MFDLSKIFFLTLLVSIIGSLQIGPIAILAMHTTLNHNLKSGLKVAFCGVIPEYIYSLVAYFGYSFLAQKPVVIHTIQLIVIPFFLILGIFNFFKKQKNNKLQENPSVKDNALRAFRYGIYNPMLLSFWILSLLLIGTYVDIRSPIQISAFALATGTGGFLAKCVFSGLTVIFRDTVFQVFQRFSINKIIGVLFMLLAIIQSIKVLAM